MKAKQPSVMQLPAEQQALLLGILPELLRMARHLHHRMFYDQQICQAEDLLQEGLSNMLTASVFPPAELAQLRTWAYATFKRRALDYLDRRKRSQHSADGYVQELAYQELPPYSGEEKVAYLFRMAHRHLRPVTVEVLQGYYAGRSGKEIAEQLDLPHATVRTHFHSAKKRLQQLCLTGLPA